MLSVHLGIFNCNRLLAHIVATQFIKVAWQQFMWCNYCTRGKYGCTKN